MNNLNFHPSYQNNPNFELFNYLTKPSQDKPIYLFSCVYWSILGIVYWKLIVRIIMKRYSLKLELL